MTDREIAHLRLELEKAEHGLSMPYGERVRELRQRLIEARKRKVSGRLARMRARQELRR